MVLCEASTLESEEQDSIDEHETVIFEMLCSCNCAPELAKLRAPRMHEDCSHLKALICKNL